MTAALLAFDLGAESGRAIRGRLQGDHLSLEELHRFPTGATHIHERLYWDALRLQDEIRNGLRAAAAQGPVASVGIDTWGVDFALLAADGTLLDNPRHYRDPRTEGVMDRALERVPRERVFAATGLQFMPINTLFQLLAMQETGSPQLAAADRFLMIADLLHYFLSGERVCEFTNATTTQFYDPRQGRWSTELFDAFGLPTAILPEIVPPGTRLGAVLDSVADDCGLDRGVPVVAPATHDTGAAVAAVPADGRDFAYISSGTWSLMGAELDAPNVSDAALRYNFTNEGGVGGTFRFLKNITGLWLVQECRRTWLGEGHEHSYAELTEAARRAPAFGSLLDPDDPRFLAPGDMPGRVRAYCRDSGQPDPADEGALIRCVLESLALKYRWVLERLEEILGRRLEPIHVVGGGIQNELLCQLTADAAGRPVVAGPAEATAAGNLLVQALGLGWLDSVADIRRVVRTSFVPTTYAPAGDTDRWEAAYQRFLALLPDASG